MFELLEARYAYRINERELPILTGTTWSFPAGSFTALCAPSGSGKSTLLNVLGLLDQLTGGQYRIDGQNVTHLNDHAQSRVRAREIGFLFQNFRLVPDLNIQKNIELALEIAGVHPAERASRAVYSLEQVGLADRLDHHPPELSGGEAQRVALARALSKTPRLLLADEPTGNLDAINRERILNLIREFHAGGGTVIMVTHDPAAAAVAEQVLTLRGGKLQPSTALDEVLAT